jgi:hypothetical protein
MFKNLLQWLTELRKTLYLCLQVYYKGYNLGTEKWKKLIGQGMWGKEFPFSLQHTILLAL